MSIYTSTYASLPQLPGSADLQVPLEREQEGEQLGMPQKSYKISMCVDLLKKGYANVTGAKFAQALQDFTSILQVHIARARALSLSLSLSL